MSIASPSLGRESSEHTRGKTLLLQLSKLSISRGSGLTPRPILTDTFAPSPGSICLAALDNASSFVCKHIVPITPIQLAKHEMTAKAVRGSLLFADAASLKAQACSDNAGWDFSQDEETLHLSFQMFCIFIKREPISALQWILRRRKWTPVLLLQVNVTVNNQVSPHAAMIAPIQMYNKVIVSSDTEIFKRDKEKTSTIRSWRLLRN